MKLEILTKYAKSIFGKDNYSVAVGLRIDEIDRVRKDYKTNNVFYPLIFIKHYKIRKPLGKYHCSILGHSPLYSS